MVISFLLDHRTACAHRVVAQENQGCLTHRVRAMISDEAAGFRRTELARIIESLRIHNTNAKGVFQRRLQGSNAQVPDCARSPSTAQ